MSISCHYNCENFSHRKHKVVEISSDEEASDGPQQKKKAKTESKIKTKLINGKCKCVQFFLLQYILCLLCHSSLCFSSFTFTFFHYRWGVQQLRIRCIAILFTFRFHFCFIHVFNIHKITSQEKDMQNTVAQKSESAKMDLAVNMLPVGIQPAAPPTPVSSVQLQPTFMPSNLQTMA